MRIVLGAENGIWQKKCFLYGMVELLGAFRFIDDETTRHTDTTGVISALQLC